MSYYNKPQPIQDMAMGQPAAISSDSIQSKLRMLDVKLGVILNSTSYLNGQLLGPKPEVNVGKEAADVMLHYLPDALLEKADRIQSLIEELKEKVLG